MWGAIGTALVIAQMAGLAFNVNPVIVMAIGLTGALCWIIHATIKSDRWLIVTNAAVACFAAYGIIT